MISYRTPVFSSGLSVRQSFYFICTRCCFCFYLCTPKHTALKVDKKETELLGKLRGSFLDVINFASSHTMQLIHIGSSTHFFRASRLFLPRLTRIATKRIVWHRFPQTRCVCPKPMRVRCSLSVSLFRCQSARNSARDFTAYSICGTHS